MKLGVIKQRHEEFYDRSRFTKVNDDLELYETTHKGDRCIITWSRQRAERDRKTREEVISKITKKLTKKKSTSKDFVTNKGYNKYMTGLQDGSPKLNDEAIALDALKDGFLALLQTLQKIRCVLARFLQRISISG